MPRLDFYAGRRPFLSVRVSARELLIGRAAECDIQLNSASVSRRHARILNLDDGHAIEDLSRNGTRLNETWVRGCARLDSGDRVGIGDLQFVYQADDAPMVELRLDATQALYGVVPPD